MQDQAISYAFLLFEVACGIAIVGRFRGSPGALLGGLAFGIWAATSLTRKGLDALEVQWGDYNLAFRLLGLAGYGCLLAAFITGRTGGGSREMSPQSTTPPPPSNAHLPASEVG